MEEQKLNRINRGKYFLILLGLAVLNVFLSFMGEAAIIFNILIAIAGIYLAVLRLHDMDKSGWYALFAFVPLANLILGLTCLFAKGTAGPNQYGPDPLDRPSQNSSELHQ